MTEFETAILDILRQARPRALTNSDIQTALIAVGFAVPAVSLHRITVALIALADAGQVRNELAWRALAEVPPNVEPT